VLQRPGCFAFIYYALLDPALPALIVLATLIAYFFHNLMFVSGAALTQCFTPRLRYSGMSIGFQFATVFSAGPAPLIATALLAWAESNRATALYIFGCAVVSIAAVAALPDARHSESEETGSP
jgi:hypothetical protein